MIATLSRFFRGSIRPRARPGRHASLQEMQRARAALLDCIADCDNLPAKRLRHQIESAKTGQELWLLRNDAYQLISQRHSQTVAAERINGLLRCFEAFIDARQLVRIQ